jgi:hypothetical protein
MEKEFIELCSEGDLIGAKQLLQLNPDINISAEDDYAFRGCCIKKYLDVAQWLQSLKPHLYEIIYDENGRFKDYKIRK